MEVAGGVGVGVDGPSLPPNYITIHQLKQRWLQQQQQQQQLNPKPTIDDSASEISNEPVPRKRNQNGDRSINQLKPPEVTLHNSASKTLVVHVALNQLKPEVPVRDFASKTLDVHVASNHPKVEIQDHKTASKRSKARKPSITPSEPEPVEEKKQYQRGRRSRNQKLKHNTAPVAPQNDDGVVVAAHLKEQHQAGRGSRNKKVFRPKTPPLNAAAGDNDDGVVEAVAVSVAALVIEQHQAGLGSRNKKLLPPKTPPFDAGGDDGIVAVAASVKEINICNVSHTRGDRTWSRSNQYPKPPFGGKKGQMSQVWVKKGESAPN